MKRAEGDEPRTSYAGRVSSVTQGRRQSILNKSFSSWSMNLAVVSVFNPFLRIMSMAAEEEALPQLLILKPPWLFSDYQHKFSPKFQLLKAWESPLPTHLFLTTHGHSVKAVLSSISSPITSDILLHLPSLRLIVATSVGLNQIDLPECRRRGISIANAGKILSEDCADMAVGLFIDVLRKISVGDRFVRSGLWPIQREFPLGSKVLILRPPLCFSTYEHKLSPIFQVLKAWESPLPIHLFLNTHAHSVTVLLCSSSSPIIADLLCLLPSLRLVLSAASGFNHIDLSECHRWGISVIGGSNFSQLMVPPWQWAFH